MSPQGMFMWYLFSFILLYRSLRSRGGWSGERGRGDRGRKQGVERGHDPRAGGRAGRVRGLPWDGRCTGRAGPRPHCAAAHVDRVGRGGLRLHHPVYQAIQPPSNNRTPHSPRTRVAPVIEAVATIGRGLVDEAVVLKCQYYVDWSVNDRSIYSIKTLI